MKFIFIFFLFFTSIYAQTIKDITNIVGIRENQLLGYGLVVGLAGTGDKSTFTMQSLQNLLRNSYIKIPTSSIKSKNIAAVMVTAMLPPFARQGDKIKVKISAIGDAKSINNGELLLTQLKGVDGNVYGLAQGTIIADRDNETTGMIYEGAMIENEVPFTLRDEKNLTLSLIKASATDADMIQRKINEKFGAKIAFAEDTRTVTVKKPPNISMVRFIAQVQTINLDSTFKKRIIIDLNRQMIISGNEVPIGPVTVSKDNFIIRIKKSDLNNEQWDNVEVNKGMNIGDDIVIADKPIVDLDNTMINTKGQPKVSDLVRAMKVMKLPMSDIIDTLKLIKELGALDAELEIRG
ncbi:flagellar P-ring protein [Arcobacter nitrofigilis DSM 7299]|uniref:Flagellar P-ring protein n=1 Tax=Arcobacter nitrofigilis (strain ATCC 33309 / DSM 7299 / CCUG 15893 / LMG 7604 / NCTC 12251 / CI) TaxID=572480 RepID=D5V7A9_ARCNC|nr:flagellar basal body P-ring protein FlgI [Arcobacter nitrofigilis]ADG94529.1 flagellar P-ring protein [Arcobacter nitrofigilis DSM 7299]